MNELSFEREVLDRLITIETQLKSVVQQCPAAQDRINRMEIQLAKCEASVKSAHHRIDGAFKTVAWIAGAITLVINVLSFVIERVK